MAFLKEAAAKVEDSSVQADDWNALRKQASSGGNGFVKNANNVNLNKYNPNDYLLSHCTIIASVDVDEVSNVKTGQQVEENGRTIKRPYNDYYITSDTSKYINQNGDAWERDLLLNTYETFIGAENYVEHVQVPELSKGKVIDAVARDLDDTVYVDILVATNRKHKSLVKDIEDGKVNKLSMGCSIAYSICTKCGNVAADEVDLCDHVKHMKGSTFTDKEGNKREIAELCGHREDPESVKFIEASWVVDPAFDGAVLRKVLGEEEKREYDESSFQGNSLVQQMENANQISLARQSTDSSMDSFLKSASYHGTSYSLYDIEEELNSAQKVAQWGDEEEEEDGGEEDKDPIQKALEEVKEYIGEESSEKVKEKIDEALEEKGEDSMEWSGGETLPEDLNENILQSYNSFQGRYSSQFSNKDQLAKVFQVLWKAENSSWNDVKSFKSVSNKEIVTAMYLRDRDVAKNTLPQEVYKCLKEVGGARNYVNMGAFLNSCKLALNREPSKEEKKILIRRSKYLK